jgi:NAD(P)-dependent dehydrogenase (short-subunit alcohol dehydrogenase family)
MQRILIIGASSGIGLTIAKDLIENGHEVISISRNKPTIDGITFFEYDVLSDEPLPSIDGKIDSLIYCPGSINLKPFRTLKKQDFLSDFNLNVYGAIKIMQHYQPNLLQSDNASIVLFSTVAVNNGMPFHSSISVSKGAIEGLTKSLAAEFAPKIRVNCIAPSLTNTPLAEKLLNTPEKIEAGNQRHPLKRLGNSEDIANAAVFLISEKACWITGQIIHVDGGMSTIKL